MALKQEAALRKDTTSAYSDMQHRHFATVAAIIKLYDAPFSELSPVYKTEVAQHFARELAKTNPKFDRARFLRACGEEV